MHPYPTIALVEQPSPLLRPTRRSVVQWLASSMALAAAGCSRQPDERIYSYAHMPEIEANGTALFYASACLRDGFAQGVLLATQQGRPVKVEGNPSHPASLGGTDVFAQAEILQLWDPDRSTAVWHRDSAGGATPSTWQAFDSAWRMRGAGTRPVADGAVHVLTSRFTSPTLAAQLAAFLRRNPGSRWYRDDAAPAEAAHQGAVLAFGRAMHNVYRLERADLIVAIGADPFSDPAAGVRYASDWARARSAALARHQLPARLLALETTPGLFGARADERWALAPPALEAVLWQTAAAFVEGLAAPGAAPGSELAQIADRLTTLLRQHRGRAILVGGPQLSAESHALLHLLNQRLDAYTDCIRAIAPPDLHEGVLPNPASLSELGQAMDSGVVQTLLMLDTNPAYGAPSSMRFADKLSRVPLSIHLGCYRDETARACSWHLPCGHTFEQWSDARAFDATPTILQPAIAPLYDTRSVHALLASMSADAGASVADDHAIVRAFWRSALASSDFDALWTRGLRRGVVADKAAAVLVLPPARVPSVAPSLSTGAGALWGVFPPDLAVGDGRHANNGWLQELPRPLTKISWGNALHLGPATALSLGLASGDIVRARVAGRGDAAVDVPVWVQSGHAEGAATLPSGYGRRAAGRVGDGVGVDAAALRSASQAVVPLLLERVGGGHVFARTQLEFEQHGRELARVVTMAAADSATRAAAPVRPSLYPPLDPKVAQEGPAWAMAIDLDACTGCNACTIACQAENNIPVVGPQEVRLGRVMHWIRIDSWQDESDRVVSQPVPCMHCENAPCEVVCPVGATMHDSEGLNVQVYNRCVGTRFCSNNCPYKVRRFNFRQYSDVKTETLRLMHNPEVTVRSRGVMEKCSYCVQRLSHARRAEQKSGEALPRDTVRTACQSVCPTQAIHFGDMRDPQSDVSLAKASPRHYEMLGQLNTRPRTTYLARIAAQPKDAA